MLIELAPEARLRSSTDQSPDWQHSFLAPCFVWHTIFFLLLNNSFILLMSSLLAVIITLHYFLCCWLFCDLVPQVSGFSHLYSDAITWILHELICNYDNDVSVVMAWYKGGQGCHTKGKSWVRFQMPPVRFNFSSRSQLICYQLTSHWRNWVWGNLPYLCFL